MMKWTLYFVVIYQLAQLTQGFLTFGGINRLMWSPPGCIACFQTEANNYFQTLHRLSPHCADEEIKNFDGIAAKYFLAHICVYQTGTGFQTQYESLQNYGNLTLRKFRKCFLKAGLDPADKNYLNSSTKIFENARKTCESSDFLEKGLMGIRQLYSEPPPSPPSRREQKRKRKQSQNLSPEDQSEPLLKKSTMAANSNDLEESSDVKENNDYTPLKDSSRRGQKRKRKQSQNISPEDQSEPLLKKSTLVPDSNDLEKSSDVIENNDYTPLKDSSESQPSLIAEKVGDEKAASENILDAPEESTTEKHEIEAHTSGPLVEKLLDEETPYDSLMPPTDLETSEDQPPTVDASSGISNIETNPEKSLDSVDNQSTPLMNENAVEEAHTSVPLVDELMNEETPSDSLMPPTDLETSEDQPPTVDASSGISNIQTNPEKSLDSVDNQSTPLMNENAVEEAHKSVPLVGGFLNEETPSDSLMPPTDLGTSKDQPPTVDASSDISNNETNPEKILDLDGSETTNDKTEDLLQIPDNVVLQDDVASLNNISTMNSLDESSEKLENPSSEVADVASLDNISTEDLDGNETTNEKTEDLLQIPDMVLQDDVASLNNISTMNSLDESSEKLENPSSEVADVVSLDNISTEDLDGNETTNEKTEDLLQIPDMVLQDDVASLNNISTENSLDESSEKLENPSSEVADAAEQSENIIVDDLSQVNDDDLMTHADPPNSVDDSTEKSYEATPENQLAPTIVDSSEKTQENEDLPQIRDENLITKIDRNPEPSEIMDELTPNDQTASADADALSKPEEKNTVEPPEEISTSASGNNSDDAISLESTTNDEITMLTDGTSIANSAPGLETDNILDSSSPMDDEPLENSVEPISEDQTESQMNDQVKYNPQSQNEDIEIQNVTELVQNDDSSIDSLPEAEYMDQTMEPPPESLETTENHYTEMEDPSLIQKNNAPEDEISLNETQEEIQPTTLTESQDLTSEFSNDLQSVNDNFTPVEDISSDSSSEIKSDDEIPQLNDSNNSIPQLNDSNNSISTTTPPEVLPEAKFEAVADSLSDFTPANDISLNNSPEIEKSIETPETVPELEQNDSDTESLSEFVNAGETSTSESEVSSTDPLSLEPMNLVERVSTPKDDSSLHDEVVENSPQEMVDDQLTSAQLDDDTASELPTNTAVYEKFHDALTHFATDTVPLGNFLEIGEENMSENDLKNAQNDSENAAEFEESISSETDSLATDLNEPKEQDLNKQEENVELTSTTLENDLKKIESNELTSSTNHLSDTSDAEATPSSASSSEDTTEPGSNDQSLENVPLAPESTSHEDFSTEKDPPKVEQSEQLNLIPEAALNNDPDDFSSPLTDDNIAQTNDTSSDYTLDLTSDSPSNSPLMDDSIGQPNDTSSDHSLDPILSENQYQDDISQGKNSISEAALNDEPDGFSSFPDRTSKPDLNVHQPDDYPSNLPLMDDSIGQPNDTSSDNSLDSTSSENQYLTPQDDTYQEQNAEPTEINPISDETNMTKDSPTEREITTQNHDKVEQKPKEVQEDILDYEKDNPVISQENIQYEFPE